MKNTSWYYSLYYHTLDSYFRIDIGIIPDKLSSIDILFIENILKNIFKFYLFDYDVSFTVWDKVLFVSMDSSISDVVIKEESSISGVSFFSWEKWFLNL